MTGKRTGIILAVLLQVLLPASCGRLTEREEAVHTAWADVETLCQRRAALVPNLLRTVRTHAPDECAVLAETAAAYAAAASASLSGEELTPERLSGYGQVQERLHAALEQLAAVAEYCPELKGDPNFRALRQEIVSAERRIAAELDTFNGAVREYNAVVERFPFRFAGYPLKPRLASFEEQAVTSGRNGDGDSAAAAGKGGRTGKAGRDTAERFREP